MLVQRSLDVLNRRDRQVLHDRIVGSPAPTPTLPVKGEGVIRGSGLSPCSVMCRDLFERAPGEDLGQVPAIVR